MLSKLSIRLKASNAFYSRIASSTIQQRLTHNSSLHLDAKTLTLSWPNKQEHPQSTFHYTWLRDNCQCPNCVHPSNRQKLHSSGDVSLTVKPEHVEVVEGGPGVRPVLKVVWPEGSLRPPPDNIIGAGRQTGKHTSTYDLEWLSDRAYDTTRLAQRHAALEPTTWDSDAYSRVRKDVTYESVMDKSDTTGFRSALTQLSEYGLVFIRGVPTNDKQVEELAHRFGCIRETFYGTSWDVKSVPQAKNIAYTSLPLGLHMDLLYFEAPPGLQFLHCLRNTVKGGSSIFVDSHRAIQILKHQHPTHYKTLTTTPVTFHYQNDNRHYHFRRATIIPNDLNEYYNVYYAPPFQGPMEASPEDVEKFYEAFQVFTDLLNADGMVYTTLLGEGDCVIFANRRVLHGRTEFDSESGERHLKGTYVDWDDFKDKLRVEGVGKVRL
ncbi:hypothetical protein HDV00_002603 [Rhizophlyctis rosea]|nr:hypothetical protein HDV00_002603 [Rhizophlyctis rosea]